LSISSVFNRPEVATMAAVYDRRRPDPQLGVFETLLVLDGHAVELGAHLARLEASLEELFPDRPAPSLGEIAPQVERGSVRIAVVPTGDRLDAKTTVRAVERQSRSLALRSVPVLGGLGAHKWADRSLLDEAQAALPADAIPLIVDRDGAVLEASRANVFAVRDGALFTPPLDGRILPGVTRMRVLEIAAAIDLEARETELRRNDVLTADEVFLTGSVRGIERVRCIDGAPLSGGDDVTHRLATELWQVWAGAKTALR
jgi:para-aminobenzoate synthetase / 4-amino-4-deoxychorismate lyase